MHLEIKLTKLAPETVDSAVINKLYDLYHNRQSGDTFDLLGYIKTGAIFRNVETELETAFQDLEIEPDDYYITFEDSEVENVIKTALNKAEGEGITIQEASNTVANYFQNNTDIESFDELKYFKTGSYNFSGCTNLESVDITDKYGTFNNCTNLVNWYGGRKPNGYLYIGDHLSVAKNCPGLTEIEIGEDAPNLNNNEFENSANIEIVRCKPVANYEFGYPAFNGGPVKNVYIENMDNWLTCRTYGSGMMDSNTKIFYNNQLVTSVEIPQSVTQIGIANRGGCFVEYRHLTSVQFHSGITSIALGTFYNCTNLVIPDLNLPNLTSLGSYAFKGTKIQTISDLGSITSIPSNCFESCSLLTNVTLSASCNSVGNDAFKSCNALTRVDIPDLNSWLNINFGNYASTPVLFSKHLFINGYEPTKILPYGSTVNGTTELTFPQGITTLKPQVFRGVSSLLQVVIPSLITSIPESCFSSCISLASVTFESLSAITSIDSYAFEKCTSLLSINLPNVTTIGYGAFSDCKNLYSITIPNSVTSISGRAFTFINIDPSQPDAICLSGGITFGTGLTKIALQTFCKAKFTSLDLPANITTLENYAIDSCSYLQSIIMRGVTSIGDRSFRGSVLNTITIETSSVPTIHEKAFKNDNGQYINSGNFTIYVPSNLLSSYQTAQNWSTLYNDGKIQPITTT